MKQLIIAIDCEDHTSTDSFRETIQRWFPGEAQVAVVGGTGEHESTRTAADLIGLLIKHTKDAPQGLDQPVAMDFGGGQVMINSVYFDKTEESPDGDSSDGSNRVVISWSD